MTSPCDKSEIIKEMRVDIKKILQRVSKLEVKASFFGIIGGALVMLLQYLTK